MNPSAQDQASGSTPPLSGSRLEELTKFDSPTIANVIELFNLRSRAAGYSNHSLKAIYPELPPVVGYAVTATYRSGYPADKGDSYGGMGQLIQDAASQPAPRIMVVQDMDETPRAATYGEVMVTAFQTFGFTGIITSGAGRDIEQVRELRFPCWASSIVVSHGYCRFLDFHLPVVVGGLQVHPGDLIHADGNGVVSIPNRIAPFLPDFCRPFIQAEQNVLDYLNSPAATPAGYAEAMKKMRADIDGLREEAQACLKQQKKSNPRRHTKDDQGPRRKQEGGKEIHQGHEVTPFKFRRLVSAPSAKNFLHVRAFCKNPQVAEFWGCKG